MGVGTGEGPQWLLMGPVLKFFSLAVFYCTRLPPSVMLKVKSAWIKIVTVIHSGIEILLLCLELSQVGHPFQSPFL